MALSTERMDPRTPLLKGNIEEEVVEVDSSDVDDDLDDPLKRKELERRLLWKLDKRMSILMLIYILNFIDRNNAGAARLRGFEDDLQLKGQQFATVLSVLYIGYISMQVPSNMFLNHIGKPSVYLPVCMSLWGFVSLMTGFARNFYDVLFTRFVLGILEASFFPGALFLISKWYKRNETGVRTSILFCGGIISNAFGALIASAILDNMEGVLGRAAWRWLFYTEGFVTIVVALSAMFILPDFPETTRRGWLTDQEIRLALLRMHEDSDHSVPIQQESRASMLKSGFWLAMKDGNVYLLTLVQAAQNVSAGFTVYFPTLAATLGVERKIALLLCAPPYLCAAVLAYFVARRSDRENERFMHIALPFCVGIFGLMIPFFTTNVTARYVSMFLMPQSYAGIGVLFAWCGNTFPSPPAKRAVALAFINSFSQFGNALGAYAWPVAWAPTYRPSYMICMLASLSTIALCYVLKRRLAALNRKLAEEEIERNAPGVGFRYLL